MKKVLSVALALGLGFAAAAPAFAQTVPPTTVNAPSSNNNGVSNPVGQNTNVQVNNSYSGMNSFGVGIQCATPYLATGVYDNNTAVNNGTVGVGVANNAGSNNSTGVTMQLIVPFGGTQQSNCTALSNEIVKQRQLDTQITLIQRCADFAKAGITLDARIYPELAVACSGVKVAMTAPPATSNAPTASSTVDAAAPVTAPALPKLIVYNDAAKSSVNPAAVCAAVPTVVTDRDKRLLEQWKESMRHQFTPLQRNLAAHYQAELQADCIDPMRMAKL